MFCLLNKTLFSSLLERAQRAQRVAELRGVALRQLQRRRHVQPERDRQLAVRVSGGEARRQGLLLGEAGAQELSLRHPGAEHHARLAAHQERVPPRVRRATPLRGERADHAHLSGPAEMVSISQ